MLQFRTNIFPPGEAGHEDLREFELDLPVKGVHEIVLGGNMSNSVPSAIPAALEMAEVGALRPPSANTEIAAARIASRLPTLLGVPFVNE